MDIKRVAKECEGLLVEIVLSDGSTRRGTVQEPPPDTTEEVLALLDERKSAELPQGQTAVALQEYLKVVDLIPLRQLKSIMKIETTIGGLAIKTEQGKTVNQEGMQVQVRNIGRPGYVGVTYKMPGAKAWSGENVVRIANGEISLPVTMAFISYAKENRQTVGDVATRLRQRDIFVWDDDSLLLPGDDWESKIEHAIENADYFLLFLSADTIERDGYKNRELRLALKKQSMKASGKRFIIPILIDRCEPPADLRELHWLRMWENDWESRLLRAIGPLHVREEMARCEQPGR